MSNAILCGRVTEHDGEIVSVSLWEVTEFVPITPVGMDPIAAAEVRRCWREYQRHNIRADFVPLGSPEHREMVEQRLRILPVEEVMPNERRRLFANQSSLKEVTGAHRAETSESKLVGRAERAKTWRFIVFALGLFWLAVILAGIWKGLAK